MMAPPEFENVVSRIETLEILATSLTSFLVCAVLVLTLAVHRAGNRFSELLEILSTPRTESSSPGK